MQPASRRATYADIEALPEHLVGELIDGELVVSPRPAPRHADAANGVGYVVSGPFRFGVDGPGGWWILTEPELHLERDVLVPDLGGWQKSRMAELPETAAIGLVPDWVCEVLSPSTEKFDRVKKLASYARHAVRHVWLLHPLHRTLEVYRLDGTTYRLVAALDEETKAAAVEPFDAVELPLGMLWSAPPDVES